MAQRYTQLAYDATSSTKKKAEKAASVRHGGQRQVILVLMPLLGSGCVRHSSSRSVTWPQCEQRPKEKHGTWCDATFFLSHRVRLIAVIWQSSSSSLPAIPEVVHTSKLRRTQQLKERDMPSVRAKAKGKARDMVRYNLFLQS
jgi:hypothetical protein